MAGFLQLFVLSLRLNFRNVQALVFGYFVPIFFLFAFKGLYSARAVPLRSEFGQLLTISTMGGACFGLPVTLVSERDRGVWRRYRLAPMPTVWFMTSILLARFVMIATSALLVFGVAMWMGMPVPTRPGELIAAYTVSAFAFLSLGIVIAMLANNTGAVQALGQCLFLPMIILGGVGVKLSDLGQWAPVASFLPSNYSVCVMTECIVPKGLGLHSTQSLFDLGALVIIGLSCCLIGVKLFRWEPEQKTTGTAIAWSMLSLAVWAVLGLAALHFHMNHAGRLSHLF
ncbi:MAG TPA: ABC transporter permease [Planctomycetota bacterium]|nr:ABC transporter permease [Planctomycetota bacterium]